MTTNNDPPDKYRCLKYRLSRILNINSPIYPILQDAVTRVNAITTKAYLVLRLWVLNKYHNNIDIPIITEDIIKMAFISVYNCKKLPQGNNLSLLQEFKKSHSFSDAKGVTHICG